MTPVWSFEGSQERDAVAQRRSAQRRYSALAAAIREHEAEARGQRHGLRPQDARLYRRLRQISDRVQ